MVVFFIHKPPCHAPLFDSVGDRTFIAGHPSAHAPPRQQPTTLLTDEADVPVPRDMHAELHEYLATLHPPAPGDPPQSMPAVGSAQPLLPATLAQHLRFTDHLWHTHCSTTSVAIVTVTDADADALYHKLIPWLQYHILAGVCTVYVREMVMLHM